MEFGQNSQIFHEKGEFLDLTLKMKKKRSFSIQNITIWYFCLKVTLEHFIEIPLESAVSGNLPTPRTIPKRKSSRVRLGFPRSSSASKVGTVVYPFPQDCRYGIVAC
jgi:hypothetical protein